MIKIQKRIFIVLITMLIFNTFIYFLYTLYLRNECKYLIVYDRLKESSQIELKNNYWVIKNVVSASKVFAFGESVTLTTNCDYTFLNNVISLISRWNGPISVAVYAPGDDYYKAMESIAFLRKCSKTDLVEKFVSFHVFFDAAHIPNKTIPFNAHKYDDNINCSIFSPFGDEGNSTYKYKNKLLYPINIARNIAREMATTYYIFPSDIELYPTRNLIPKFLTMIKEHKNSTNKEVFVLPVFEIAENETIPETKANLNKMIQEKKAVSFHENVCNICHRIPQLENWLNTTETDVLNIFTTVKRIKPHHDWEPFYIGTNKDPFFLESLTWEGQSDKHFQAYEMCLLDYDFHIVDNAFLIHKPGIKKYNKKSEEFGELFRKTNELKKCWKEQLIELYGDREGCVLN